MTLDMTRGSVRTLVPRAVGLTLAVLLVAGAQSAVASGSADSSPSLDDSADVGEGDDVMADRMSALPDRPGPAPSVTTGVPHIQLDQTSDAEIFDELARRAFSLPPVAERPSRASLPGARALTLAEELPANQDAMIVGREFAHIHADPGAGSLHLRLPADTAAEVVESGWGEWHPFALDGSMPGLVMVYSPRDADDLDVIVRIIAASVDHATAVTAPE